MGRTFIHLDPPGYRFCIEPGFHLELKADQLGERLLPPGEKLSLLDYGFYNPAGTHVLMCKFRQWSPTWHLDSRLPDHVVNLARWTWATGITATEAVQSRKPGSTPAPDDKWITVPTIPAAVVSLDATNYTNLASACTIEFPAGMATVGMASTCPAGAISAAYTPHIQFLQFPLPDSTYVFGWSNKCLVFSGDAVYFLLSEDGKQTWKLLGLTTSGGKYSHYTFGGVQSMLAVHEFRGRVRAALAYDLGTTHMRVEVTQPAAPITARTRDYGTVIPATSSPFWWGAAPKQKLHFQAQMLGFEHGNSLAHGAANVPVLVDLGSDYKPTETGTLNLSTYLHANNAGELSTTVGAYSTATTSSLTGETIDYQFRNDGAINAFVADGTRHKGTLYLSLLPGNLGAPQTYGYLSPQTSHLELRFPVKLEDRINDELILNDTQYKSWKVEASLGEADGKRLVVELFDDAAAVLSATGHDLRESYPIEIWDDVNGTGVDEVLRAAGWVSAPDMTEHRTETATVLYPKRAYEIHARALLSRLDTGWLYLPQLVDPAGGGYIEHAFAVKETLHQSGFDVTDTARYLPFADPHTGTSVARLPGTWGEQGAVTAERDDSPWAPDWDKTKLQYLETITKQFRGWQLYEDLAGLVRYHPELWLELQIGYRYYVACTLYKTKAGAAAAGYPGQYYMPDGDRRLKAPEGNVVRVTGKDADGKVIHILDRDTEAYTNDLYQYFTGEPIPYIEPPSKLAVTEEKARQMARVMLWRKRRRLVYRSVVVPLAPWQFGPVAAEVGKVVTLEGRGDWLITHLEVQQLKSSASTPFYLTRLTLEDLPDSALAGNTVGGYPGRGEQVDPP